MSPLFSDQADSVSVGLGDATGAADVPPAAAPLSGLRSIVTTVATTMNALVTPVRVGPAPPAADDTPTLMRASLEDNKMVFRNPMWVQEDGDDVHMAMLRTPKVPGAVDTPQRAEGDSSR